MNKHFNSQELKGVSVITTGRNDSEQHTIIGDILVCKAAWEVKWPVLTSREYADSFYARIIPQQGIILILCSDNEDELPEDFEDILTALTDNKSWNRKTKFIVIIQNIFGNKTLDLARNLFEFMWENSRIINVVAIVYTVGIIFEENIFCISNKNKQTFLETYTWFPYRDGNCKEVINIVSMGKYFIQNYTYHSEINIFPYKIPDNFMGCTMTVLPYGLPPYQITTETIGSSGNVIYEESGIPFQFLKLFADKFNITLLIQKPIQDLDISEGLTLINNIKKGTADFTVGTIVLLPMTEFFIHTTIPILYDTVKLLSPCPTPIPRVERVISIFTSEVWISIGMVIISASMVLWFLSRKETNSQHIRLSSFRKLSQCLQNTWASLFGVSVSEMPTSSRVRCFFMIYICFCIALNTVFQAYFTTFLIEPGYGKGVETLVEVNNIGMGIGYTYIMVQMAFQADYNVSAYKRQVECENLAKCMERTMFEGDIVTITLKHFAYYQAIANGIQDTSRVVCFLDEIIFSAYFVIGTHKGSPIMYDLNKIINEHMEMGLIKKFSSLSIHSIKLKPIRETENVEEYFVFSIVHLAPVFIILICGCLLSSTVFIFELGIGFCRKKFSRIFLIKYIFN
ncbi:hypothetical protein L9F63_000196 [Diploptera punctata]|uniref:Ionotropic glutamate receptor C-terminal domain-containing protein n=1 Tax=Diploptera punctata TaxID=6984 RepID=A0AAD8ESY3_DIPPU|nr:hypothetical protein L9F63_000196 [Diploptera punctata]